MNDIAQKYDLVVSNPPYISNAEYNKLDQDVIDTRQTKDFIRKSKQILNPKS